MFVVAELLREIYRRQGDLAVQINPRTFSSLRATEAGIDPLGLELRIEQLLRPRPPRIRR